MILDGFIYMPDEQKADVDRWLEFLGVRRTRTTLLDGLGGPLVLSLLVHYSTPGTR